MPSPIISTTRTAWVHKDAACIRKEGSGHSGLEQAPHFCTVASDSRDPFVDYVLQLFGTFSGLEIRLLNNDSEAHPDVYYGSDPSRRCALRIPKLAAYTLESVPVPPLLSAKAGYVSDAVFPFDVFEAVRFWITDQGNANAPPSAYDPHERLRPEASAQEFRGVRELPIVNAYFACLRTYVEARTGTRLPSRLPQERKCAVVLSHDVENPVHVLDASQNMRLAGLAFRGGNPLRAAAYARNAFRGILAHSRIPRHQHWQFDNITKSEDRFGFRSTFFFSSFSSAEGNPLDLSYDVRAPRFRQITERLAREGWEVGLQLSYDARKSPQQIARERRRLEAAIGRPVRGTRHHYWHLSCPMWKTLEDHGKAGIGYDTSVAFNDKPGYRLGIAYPFRPWHPTMNRPVSTVQIPTLFMDGAFFYDPAQTVDGVLQQVSTLIEQLKMFTGVAAIDWHDYTSYPACSQFRAWGEAYIEILRLLASDNSVAVLSCEQLLSAVPCA